MSFTIEFQPVGVRLVNEEPLTLLDAARRAGLALRADCGGAGTCGKCRVQVAASAHPIPPVENDRRHLSEKQIGEGFRLACSAVADGDCKVLIPVETMLSGQVLQTSGEEIDLQVDSPIQQQAVVLPPPTLEDLRSDFERLKDTCGLADLTADLETLRRLPEALRSSQWHINLIRHGHTVMHFTPAACRPLAGLAVDVGSTKLACYLLDLETGRLLAAKGAPNPQIGYGEDIMARLAYAQQGAQQSQKLHNLVIETIQNTAVEMCRQVGIADHSIADACLVGNTAMHHFFLNLSGASLAVSPFVPAVSSAQNVPAEDIGLIGMPGMRVYAPPVIAGFVGSDHLAFLYACAFGRDERTRLGIDIGTNTEIALQKGGRIVSVSTASGPAFEGAHIQFGMRAAPGAIEHVRIRPDGRLELDVIGDRQPNGICGSGILDALGEMRAAGMFNRRGRLEKTHPAVKLDENGMAFFPLSDDPDDGRTITLSQHDIDQVLLAKGAIRAGIEVLMDYLKIQPVQIDEVVIAGAFGSYMLPEQAIRIGMLPEIPLEKIRAVGNAAGAGARSMLVSAHARTQAEALARRMEYLELSLYPDFDLFYARGIQA